MVGFFFFSSFFLFNANYICPVLHGSGNSVVDSPSCFACNGMDNCEDARAFSLNMVQEYSLGGVTVNLAGANFWGCSGTTWSTNAAIVDLNACGQQTTWIEEKNGTETPRNLCHHLFSYTVFLLNFIPDSLGDFCPIFSVQLSNCAHRNAFKRKTLMEIFPRSRNKK